MTSEKRLNVAFVSQLNESNSSNAALVLDDITDILRQACHRVYIITGSNYSYTRDSNVKVITVKQVNKPSVFIRGIGYLIADWKLALRLAKMAKSVDIILYYLAIGYPVSMLVSRTLLRKKVVLASFNTVKKSKKVLSDSNLPNVPGRLHFKMMELLERISFDLAGQIWVESESIISFGEHDSHRKKTVVCGSHYLDVDKYRIIQAPENRGHRLGYLGRLSSEKGIMELIRAIPALLKQEEDLQILIGGKGPLSTLVAQQLTESGYEHRVELLGWIPEEEKTRYLNQLRLLVMPSYSEGLSNVVQQAMACGTVVVATPVGGIPDLIKDGETGFIMPDNRPETIAENVLRALHHPELNRIASNARQIVEQECNFDVIVRRYQKALEELMGEPRETG